MDSVMSEIAQRKKF